MALCGAVEIGGTKCDVAFGTSPGDLTEPVRIETTNPEETLSRIARVLKSQPVDRVGVACFGPLDLGTGTIRSTPKEGWTGAAVGPNLQAAVGCEVVVDTDVNGAARGEGRWGAAKGLANFAYVTVGTGIGAGVVVAGRPIGGAGHPEFGHVVVSRHPDDTFDGICQFHGDCLEGMACGPALEARFGDPILWKTDAVDLAGFYIAQGARALHYVAAPERIIIGGGVSNTPGFHEVVRTQLAHTLADYPEALRPDELIVPPGLGHLSGLAGALLLAAIR